MHVYDRRRSRWLTATAATMAVALSGSVLALSQARASAEPSPAAYSADAHGDIVGLDVDLLRLDLAGVAVGHSQSAVDSTATGGTSTANSANLDGNLLGTGLSFGEQEATAPPSENPDAQELAAVGLAPVITVGAVRGDTEAAFSDDLTTCVPANAAGERTLADAQTRLAGLSLVNLPLIGRVANVTTSQTRTRTFLEDDGTGASDVVSRTTTTIGDISLLGEAVGIKVTDPVVLEARSDGTTGTASYVNPPSVSVTAAGTTVNVLPGQTQRSTWGPLVRWPTSPSPSAMPRTSPRVPPAPRRPTRSSASPSTC